MSGALLDSLVPLKLADGVGKGVRVYWQRW